MGTHDHDNAVRSIRSRHIRSTTGVPPIRITKRDLDLLASLVDFRILTTTQIQRLFFRSLHRARKRLFKLWQHGVVDRVFRPVALGESPSEAIYSVAAKGARMLARALGSSEQASAEVNRRKKMSPFFLEHTLAVSDFRIALMRSCNHTTHARLLYWRQGPSIGFEQRIVDQESRTIMRVPVVADGMAAIDFSGDHRSFFIELDRGTVPLRRWRRRYAAYLKAAYDQALCRRLGLVRFSVLIVTLSYQRLENLRNAAKPYSPLNSEHGLFRFGLVNEVAGPATDLLSQPLWLSPSGNEPMMLRPHDGHDGNPAKSKVEK